MAFDHYVARTYLKRWCDQAKKEPIQAYRKSDPKQFPCWPDDVCTERDGDLNPNYFADPALLGQYRSIFEPNWDAAAHALQNGRMRAEDKFVIAGYWANLNVTTPTLRVIGAELFEKEIHSILPTITKDRPVPENVKISVEIDPNYIKALVTKNLLRGAWQFYNRQWSILSNDTAHPFLTSDNPSAVLPPEVIGGPTARVLPLSPKLCVATLMDTSKMPLGELTLTDLQSPPQGLITYNKADAACAKFVNRLTVINAENLVFSRTANSGVAALVEKYRDYGAQLKHTVRPVPANDGFFTHASIRVGRKRP
jgi:hypothetical protein